MGFIWDPFGINMGFIWVQYGFNMGSIWDQYGINMGSIGPVLPMCVCSSGHGAVLAPAASPADTKAWGDWTGPVPLQLSQSKVELHMAEHFVSRCLNSLERRSGFRPGLVDSSSVSLPEGNDDASKLHWRAEDVKLLLK